MRSCRANAYLANRMSLFFHSFPDRPPTIPIHSGTGCRWPIPPETNSDAPVTGSSLPQALNQCHQRLIYDVRRSKLVNLSWSAPQPASGDSAVAQPTTAVFTRLVRAPELTEDTPSCHILLHRGIPREIVAHRARRISALATPAPGPSGSCARQNGVMLFSRNSGSDWPGIPFRCDLALAWVTSSESLSFETTPTQASMLKWRRGRSCATGTAGQSMCNDAWDSRPRLRLGPANVPIKASGEAYHGHVKSLGDQATLESASRRNLDDSSVPSVVCDRRVPRDALVSTLNRLP